MVTCQLQDSVIFFQYWKPYKKLSFLEFKNVYSIKFRIIIYFYVIFLFISCVLLKNTYKTIKMLITIKYF